MGKSRSPIRRDAIDRAIVQIRDREVILDCDLARLYGISPAALHRAVRGDRWRFPEDFAFQLSAAELAEWKGRRPAAGASQKAHRSRRPYAFTEHGVAMLSGLAHLPT